MKKTHYIFPTHYIFLFFATLIVFYLLYGLEVLSLHARGYDVSLTLFFIHFLIALATTLGFVFISKKFNYKESLYFSYIVLGYSLALILICRPLQSGGGFFSRTQLMCFVPYVITIFVTSLIMLSGIKSKTSRKWLLVFIIILIALSLFVSMPGYICC